jgi:hypothetical protein
MPVIGLAMAISLGGLGFGQTTTAEHIPGEPKRPDLSEMTPEQAEAAMAKYRADEAAWERAEAPRREAAIKEAIAAQEARKATRMREEADPTWHPPVETPKVEVASDYDWERAAQADGLDEATRALLRRDGLAIAGPGFPQSFSVYEDESQIPFVTSDSLLNGFHVLLEATLRKYELRRSQQLRTVLEDTWQNLDRRLAERKVSRAMVEPCVRHLALVIGPAMRLLGSSVPLGDPSLEAEVNATVKKINDARVVELPAWMAPVEPAFLGIDFRRCRPIGFYADNPALSDYYRATRWLQLLPLRASRDNEVGAAALLAELQPDNSDDGLKAFVKTGAEIWGKAEEADMAEFGDGRSEFLATIAKDGNTARALGQARESILRLNRWHHSPINDRLRLETDKDDATAGAAVAVLAPAVLPDAIFLEAIAAKRPLGRSWPQGLEVAAWFGSDLALKQLATSAGPELAEAVRKQWRKPEDWPPLGDTVPEHYYDVLRTQFAAPDPAAPAFMSSLAWQRKSLQTALAGWAQLRYSWELQTKLPVAAAGACRRPTGFVEPNTGFFRQMSKLESVLIARLQENRVFEDSPADEIEFLRSDVSLIDRLGLLKVDADIDRLDPIGEGEQVVDLIGIAEQNDQTISQLELGDFSKLRGNEQRTFWTQVRGAIQSRIARLERGERLPKVVSFEYKLNPNHRLFQRWQSIQDLTSQLGAMVEKQIRGADWNEDEARLLKDYGDKLAGVMGCLASEEDNAPRWTTVYHDPNIDRQLAVAIGRPRALYVLYPWKGKLILCRGAVLPYYEYVSERRLTDAEWKELLDGPNAPAQPDWIQPLLGKKP